MQNSATFSSRLYLHPVHFELGSLAPASSAVLRDEVVSLVGNDSVDLEAAASKVELDVLTHEVDIVDGELALVWPTPDTADIRIPLLLCEVSLGINPRTGLPTIMVASRPSTSAWIVLVFGVLDVARDVIARMGRSGALRLDFRETYALERMPLGKGANAVVFSAIKLHGRDARRVGLFACKVPLPGSSNRGASEVPRDLRQELALLSGLQGHPNIIQFHGLFRTGGTIGNGFPEAHWAFVMERGFGGDLYDSVVRGVFSEARARDTMQGLLSAIEHIHLHGIVHRDVKAENVLMTGDGRILLADFGIACQLKDDLEMQRHCGSPGYAAPEIILARTYDAKVDCFSCGSLFYFLLSAKVPFEGPTPAYTGRNTLRGIVDFSQHSNFHTVGGPCKELILMLCKTDPADRINAKDALQHPFFPQEHLPFVEQPQLSPGASQDAPASSPPALELEWLPAVGAEPSGASSGSGTSSAQPLAALAAAASRYTAKTRSASQQAPRTRDAAQRADKVQSNLPDMLRAAIARSSSSEGQSDDRSQANVHATGDAQARVSDVNNNTGDQARERQPSRGGYFGRGIQRLLHGRTPEAKGNDGPAPSEDAAPPGAETAGTRAPRAPSWNGSWFSTRAASTAAIMPQQPSTPGRSGFRRKAHQPEGASSQASGPKTSACTNSSAAAEQASSGVDKSSPTTTGRSSGDKAIPVETDTSIKQGVTQSRRQQLDGLVDQGRAAGSAAQGAASSAAAAQEASGSENRNHAVAARPPLEPGGAAGRPRPVGNFRRVFNRIL